MNLAATIPEFADLSPAVSEFIGNTQKLFIDGQWVNAASGATFDTIDPATENVVFAVAEASAEDVDRAARAAHKAFYEGDWSRMIPAAREALMLKWADLVETHADELAELESLNNGKLVMYAKMVDIPARPMPSSSTSANDTIYGLAASVWTRDLSTAHRLAKRIEAGTVWVNCHHLIDPALPFGGFKQSGFGREQAADGLDLYTETKSVMVKI